jgi:hypothetical protein
MTAATVRGNAKDRHPNRGLRILVLFCLLPGAAYFVVMILALFGILSPARWLSGLLSGIWSVPLLWLAVIGGPMFGAIGSLILSSGQRSGRRLDRICGGVAAVLLVFNLLSCIPFPFILAIE